MRTYALADVIEPVLTVTNRGEDAVAFWNEFASDSFGTVIFDVLDDKGRHVESWFIRDDFRRPWTNKTNRWLVLEAGESLDAADVFLVKNLVSQPGQYTLRVTYRAPSRAKDFDAPPNLVRETGPLIASAPFEVVRSLR